MGRRLSFFLVVLALLLSAPPLESQEFSFAGADAYQALLRAGYTGFERFASLLVSSRLPIWADGGGGDGGSGSVSAVDSKPASGGRIKTSHFFSFKPVGDVLARGDLRISRQIQR